MKKDKIIMIVNIILVLVSMITIFLFSSENGELSDSTSKNVTEAITIKNSESFYDNNIFIIRKVAHLTEYAVLGFLLLNLFYKKITYKEILICILIATLYACSDEIHQLFVEGRTAKLLDVLIDTIGASIGSIFYYLIYRKRKVK